MSKQSGPLGILLVNLGTPDEPTPTAIRRYLREFLSDPRVVNIPRAAWLPILYAFILPFRPRKLVEKYAYIWSEEGAPIRTDTAALAGALGTRLANMQLGREVRVAPAMTYGNPSIADALDHYDRDGIRDLMVIPLFPQYSAATTAAVYDKMAKVLARRAVVGDIRFVDEYCEQSDYIHALTKTLEDQAHHLDNGAKMIFSFHGIPKSQEAAGDPYPDRCRSTAETLAHNLGLADDQWLITFQSRFGPAPWLTPYTDETLASLPGKGTKRVVIACPGFATDCLETLHEIQVENREIFMEAGGEQFTYVPALGASDDHVELMTKLVLSRLYAAESGGPRF